MGDESGGGPSGSETRGQVGLTKAEQNARAVAQERGGRQSAGVAGPSSRGAVGARESGFASDASRAAEYASDSFTTSTEGAYRDLARRQTEGQIPENLRNIPIGGMAMTALNEMGKMSARSIQAKIDAGGTPVYDTVGRIQGVVSQQQMGEFKGDVYTGSAQYNPIGTGKNAQRGIGYVMSATDVRSTEQYQGGGDGGTATTTAGTAATSTNVTGSTTTLSNAARRQQIGAAAGGASRRQFIA